MRCLVRVAAGAAPPVQPKMSKQKLRCSTCRTLCWNIEFSSISWYLKESFSSLREGFACGVKTLTSRKVRLNLEPHNPFAFTSSRASSSVLSVLRVLIFV